MESDIVLAEKASVLENIFGEATIHGQQLDFICPECQRRKLTINLKQNKGRCWVCQYGFRDLEFLVKRHSFENLAYWRKLSGKEDKSDLKKFLTLGKAKQSGEFYDKVVLPKSYRSLYLHWDDFYSQIPKNYLSRRGITKEDVLKWQIGYATEGLYKNRIIIPSYDKYGILNYFIGRHWGRDIAHQDRYLSPKVEKTKLIFNEYWIRWGDPIHLIEGVFDGIKIPRENIIPIGGSSITVESRLFRKIVEGRAPVYLGFDYDARKKMNWVEKQFNEYGIRVYYIEPEKDRDFGDRTKEENLEIIMKANKMRNKFDIMKDKLNGGK